MTMPGLVLHAQATCACSHQGQVQIAPAQTRALVGGKPIATQSSVITVAGCVGVQGVFCTKVQWTGVSTRVSAGGSPILTQAVPPAGPVPGSGVVVGPPPNLPLVSAMQTKVTGS
jgi:hypothetical protein